MNTILDENKHPELDGDLAFAVQQILHEPIPAEPVERLKNSAIDKAHHSVLAIDHQASWLRSRAVRLTVPLIALAASALAIFVLATPSTGFAQVVDQIRKINTATFRLESKGDNNLFAFIAKATVKNPDRLRLDFERPSEMVNVNNFSTGELITYAGESGEVTVSDVPSTASDFDILRQLRDFDGQAELINEINQINGTDLYSIYEGQGRVWVDRDSNLPQRIEMSIGNGPNQSLFVYDDFKWDVSVDDSLFQIPEGRMIRRDSLTAEPSEDDLVGAFQIRHAFDQSPYGATFWGSDAGLQISQLAYDRSKNQAENNVIQRSKLRGHYKTIGISEVQAQDPKTLQRRIDHLAMKLDDWEHTISKTGGWVGTGVRPGEPKPLLWWKDGEQIRVLLADLTIVDADDPPRQK